ncbi:hypothetical protein MmiEs2_14220 [Methanimicrococcus stummii]|uniref:Right handed beta helix domain-containing protein n=2 Tax=Methanimicrococcus stummii TaxID=3028294 RepID=A0AA97A8L1_9EURY|nr:hypothetical protein MmiEs2_14220 [Methanimicrococcus sp. Es2]
MQNTNTKTCIKTKTRIIILISIFAVFFMAAGTAAAETIEVSDGQELRNAINVTNSNDDTENTIVLLNDIDLTDDLFTADEFKAAVNPSSLAGTALGLNYSKPGTLIFKSDSSAVRKINSSLAVSDYYLFLNVSGSDITLSSENVLFDGVGINLENVSQNPQMKNLQVKDIQIINCNNSGFYIDHCTNLTLENVSITNCRDGVGGGLNIWYSNLTIRDCNISNNAAIGSGSSDPRPGPTAGEPSGGGIHLLESVVDICGDTIISGNTIDGYDGNPSGAGIDSHRSYLKIYENTKITNNTITYGGKAQGSAGGGIFSDFFQSEGTIPGLEIFDSVEISGNNAVMGGGIFVNHNATEPIYVFDIFGDVNISNNTAEIVTPIYISGTTTKKSAGGGGIFTFAPVNISNDVLIQNNKAVDSSSSPIGTVGGGIYSQGSAVLSDDVQILENQASNGAGIAFFGSFLLKDNVLVAGNTAKSSGAGIYSGGKLTLQNNTTIAQNSAENSGGGLYLTNSNTKISDDVLISENTAANENIGGGGIYARNSTLDISGDVLILNNVAANGGGIFSQNSSVLLSENTSFIGNIANESSGFGGGIFMMAGSTVDVSGTGGQTVTFERNMANAGGGAVYINVNFFDLTPEELAQYADFQKKTDESDLIFTGNFAPAGYMWDLNDSDPSNLSDAMKYIQTLPVMENTTFTEPFTNAYNNFDIFFLDGDEILSAVVPVNYFADSLESSVLATEYVFSYEGAEITESDLISELGADWLNWYQPPDYEAGQLQEPLPITIDADTVLNVLYLKGSTPATVTVNYFADSLTSSPIGTKSFDSAVGTEITEDDFISEIGVGWLDFYIPDGYKPGELQEPLPWVMDADAVFNILYIKEDTSVTVTINYFADSLTSNLIGTNSFITLEGTKLTQSEIISEFGDDWINEYQPADYKAGQLQESLPLTLDDDTVLNVLYLKDKDGSGGGGGGTGTATVTDPDDSGSVPPTGPGQEAGPEGGGGSEKPPTEPGRSPIVILLFMIAIACYAYVEKEDGENDI